MLKAWGDLCHIRHDTAGGIGPWVWQQADQGAWSIPKQDWEMEGGHGNVLEGINPRRTVIQAGGNQGMYPRLLADRFEKVFTFEPDPLNFFCLTQNCQKTNIVKFQAALGSGFGSVSMNRPNRGNTGEHNVRPGSDFPLVPIDAFGFQEVDLIMLDVELAELPALQGATETIKRCGPVIIVENGDRPPLVEFLVSLGYKMAPWMSGPHDNIWQKSE
jgi:FkbM family methyltransferase